MSRYAILRLALGIAAGALTPDVRADVVRLNNGGEVRGLLQGDRRPGETVELETLLGGRVILARAEISSVSRRSPLVEEYVTRAREVVDVIEARWELAEWCREERLTQQREEQLEAILLLDPEHVPSRRGLGHVQFQGEWMSKDESMERQGYVKHKGKYLTQQEFALLNKTAAQRKAELEWYPRVRLWTGWMTGRNAGRQVEGLANLRKVDDADAIPALNEFLGGSEHLPLRELLVQRLDAMSGERPVESLVRVSLHDPSDVIRRAAFQALDPGQYVHAVPYYVEALDHSANEVVQRAGTALGVVGDQKVVPALIRALITTHRIIVQVPVNDAVSINRSPDGRYSVGGSPSILPPNIEILLRTGQLPYGVNIISPQGGQRYRNVKVKADFRNERVLEALKRLADQDFGYDQDGWQLYWAARQTGIGRN
ncbi:MAG: HEAT repeat domain-containing protein [Planctomyces sp.]|nr:HEAT repeat domain-containing protein [Planctomyces sp.]